MDSKDYKNTLLLPKTDFPMRADLPKREPEMLKRWREENIYGQIMAARQDAAADPERRSFSTTGRPSPMAMPTWATRSLVLKDIVLKYHNMRGDYAPFVPGWDCHGLPIEHKVMKDLGADETDPIKIREKCEATARHFVGVQSEQFQRLGVFGDWANPYLTLDPAYEAETLRVFATLVGRISSTRACAPCSGAPAPDRAVPRPRSNTGDVRAAHVRGVSADAGILR